MLETRCVVQISCYRTLFAALVSLVTLTVYKEKKEDKFIFQNELSLPLKTLVGSSIK